MSAGRCHYADGVLIAYCMSRINGGDESECLCDPPMTNNDEWVAVTESLGRIEALLSELVKIARSRRR